VPRLPDPQPPDTWGGDFTHYCLWRNGGRLPGSLVT
jgi:hypothetical protein